jgi:sugar lactone lactonase YvrE
MLALDALRPLGAGLNRPECALAHSSGLVLVPDWTGNGGVAAIAPGGRVARLLARDPPEPLRPNGIALEPGGSVLLAHLGAARGGLFRLHPDGGVETVLEAVEGEPLPPCNFVLRDRSGRLWLTVSTRVAPRADDYRTEARTGFIVLIDPAGPRVVADGLGYANECLLSPDGATLWVNETFGRRTTAFAVAPDGSLSERRTVAAYGAGAFPDGLALDAEGALWVVSIVSNRVMRVRDGVVETLLEDCDPAHLTDVEDAFHAGRMGRPHLDRGGGRRLMNVSNLAFGGPGLRRAHLGCLLGDAVETFEAPVPGAPPPHWDVPLGPLARFLESG